MDNFRPYYIVAKTDKGLLMRFFDTLEDLYKFALNDSSIYSYAVFRTIELREDF